MTGVEAGAPAYEPAGFFMVRTPLRPLVRVDPHEPTGSGAEEVLAAAARPRTAAAVRLASPSLAMAAERARAHEYPPGSDRYDRTIGSLRRYLIRMTSRPTPFGLFAAVATGRLAGATTLALRPDPLHSVSVRPDASWISSLVKSLEEGPFAPLLRCAVNPLLHRGGDRIVLLAADVHGESDARAVDVRWTPIVQDALDLASGGAVRADVVSELARQHPAAPAGAAERLVGQLWDLHLVTSDLRPAGAIADPLRHVLDRLPLDHALDGVRQDLEAVHALFADTEGDDLDARLAPAAELQRTLVPGHTSELVQVDARLATDGDQLHRAVGEVVADAAEVIARIGTFRTRADHLVEYHDAFIERYGLFAEVPVLELLGAEQGLEAPRTYERPARSWPLPPVPADEDVRPYDLAVTAITSEVLRAGATTLELTDERLAHLTTWRPGDGALRPTIELFVQVAAASASDIDAGDFQVVVAPGSTTDGGRTFGRFADMLTDRDRDDLRSLAHAESAGEPGVRTVSLSYQVPQGRSANVSRHHQLRDLELCVNAAPVLAPEQQVRLQDVLVGAAPDRFYLRWAVTGEEIRVVQDHLLVPTAAPNVCRFLLEASIDGFAPLAAFDWGPLAASPFLPRVTRGRVILHPAQWRLTPRQLGGSIPSTEELPAAVRRWRQEVGAPAEVYLSWLDNRLLLDLEDPDHLQLLRADLVRAQHDSKGVVLQEVLPARDATWLRAGPDGDAYVHELVVPLRLREPEDAARGRPPAGLPRPEPSPVPVHLPGEEWTCVQLYAPFGAHDRLIASVGPLVEQWRAEGLVRQWHFVRYADPRPHLRLRLRAGHGRDPFAVLTALLSWAGGCVRTGAAQDLSVVGWRPEVKRYGGAQLLEPVLAVFDECSSQAVDTVSMRTEDAAELDDVLSAWLLHEVHLAWGRDALQRTSDAPPAPLTDDARQRFRAVRPTLCALLDPSTWPATPDSVLVRGLVGDRPFRLHRALAGAGRAARDLAAREQLHGDDASIVASIAHMRLNRVIGVDSEGERMSQQLWWQAVGAVRRRRRASDQGAGDASGTLVAGGARAD